MNLSLIENTPIQELMDGIQKQNGKFCCLWCDHIADTEAEAEKHAASVHDDAERFRILLGADGLLKLTMDEKKLCTLLFEGRDQREISEMLHMNYNTVRVRRSKLYYEGLLHAKIALLFYQLVFSKQPKRSYQKQLRKRGEEQMIPYFLKGSDKICGFAANKEQLHSDPALFSYTHATTLILPAKVLPNGELHFLICDKVKFSSNGFFAEKMHLHSDAAYDCLGGHVERQDMAGVEDILINDCYGRCAARELSEELHLRNTSVEPERLRCLFTIEYESAKNEMQPISFNHEISRVYLYIISEEIDARVKEEYVDSVGMTVRHEYPSSYFTYAELLEAYEKKPEDFCDGLGRILCHIKKHPKVYAAMKRAAQFPSDAII